jgi:hypothetical protein
MNNFNDVGYIGVGAGAAIERIPTRPIPNIAIFCIF